MPSILAIPRVYAHFAEMGQGASQAGDQGRSWKVKMTRDWCHFIAVRASVVFGSGVSHVKCVLVQAPASCTVWRTRLMARILCKISGPATV